MLTSEPRRSPATAPVRSADAVWQQDVERTVTAGREARAGDPTVAYGLRLLGRGWWHETWDIDRKAAPPLTSRSVRVGWAD